jgi:hypothetical protein
MFCIIAASQAGKNLEYFSFGDEIFTEAAKEMHNYLTSQNVTVGMLLLLLRVFAKV